MKITKEQATYILERINASVYTNSDITCHGLSAANDYEKVITEIINSCIDDEPQLLKDLRLMVTDLKRLRADFDDFTAGIYK